MWPELIDVARWAPSPHNIQPWRVRIRSETDAELLYDPARLLPETDPSGRFSAVGLGVFLETLAVAARARGRDVESGFATERLEPDRGEPRLWARLRLVPYAGEPDLDPRLILERRTSRLPYDGKPVPADALDELDAVAARARHSLSTSSERDFVGPCRVRVRCFDLGQRILDEGLDLGAARFRVRGVGQDPAVVVARRVMVVVVVWVVVVGGLVVAVGVVLVVVVVTAVGPVVVVVPVMTGGIERWASNRSFTLAFLALKSPVMTLQSGAAILACSVTRPASTLPHPRHLAVTLVNFLRGFSFTATAGHIPQA